MVGVPTNRLDILLSLCWQRASKVPGIAQFVGHTPSAACCQVLCSSNSFLPQQHCLVVQPDFLHEFARSKLLSK